MSRVCALGGGAPPRFSVPVSVVRAGLALATPVFRLRGRRPPYSAGQLASLERHWAFDDARARAELDWHPRGLDAGLPPTVELLKTR